MYTYVQRPGCKKENTATYVHTGRVSNAYSRIRTARARVHGWVGTEKQRRRRVHGEATECVVFMGRQRNASCSSGGNGTRGSQPAGSERNAWSCSSGGLGRNRRWKRGLAYHKTEKTDLLRSKRGSCWSGGVWRTAKRRKQTSYGRNGGPVDQEGCGVPQNGRNGLVLERYGRNGGPVHREGCGVPQNGTPQDTVHLHRRPPLASTGYCSSTVDLLQPPPATIHPRGSCSSSLHR